MNLQRIPNDDIVTVRYEATHCAVAEAHELKSAGFGQRNVTKDFPGEWTMRAQSLRDFESLAQAVPVDADAVWRNGCADVRQCGNCAG